MISLALTFTFIGFLACYHSSKRAKFKTVYPIQDWLKTHPQIANYAGILGMVLGLGLCVFSFGWLTGMLYFLMILTLVASLSILLMPMKLLSLRSWSVFLLMLFVIEIFII